LNNAFDYQGQAFTCGGFPILNPAGEQIGAVLALEDNQEFSSIMSTDNRNLMLSIFPTLVFIFFVYYWLIRKYIVNPINKLSSGVKMIEEGNLDFKVSLDGKDEIGQLGRSFNAMTESLKESKENIEQKVAERTAEIEKLNSFMIGRELKMKELKEKIKGFEEKNNS
jgi:nitrate/nitrite-specific signal transduction histidine kinase